MDFKFTPAEEAFRDEVRAFLDANLPADANRNDFAFIAEWSRKVREKRWVGFSWPKEVGGGGGGKPHLATAGGKDAAQLDPALREAAGIVRGMLG